MELLYSTLVAKTLILLSIGAHLIQSRPSERGQSHNSSFTSESTLVMTHCFLMRREEPKRLGGFFKITCSWSEMGSEYQSEIFVAVVKQATETVSAE